MSSRGKGKKDLKVNNIKTDIPYIIIIMLGAWLMSTTFV